MAMSRALYMHSTLHSPLSPYAPLYCGVDQLMLMLMTFLLQETIP